MTHDGPGDDCWSEKERRRDRQRAEFERSGSRPDPEHSTYIENEIAFEKWQRENNKED